jgi:hypothetical protein
MLSRVLSHLDEEHPSPSCLAQYTAHVQDAKGEEGSQDISKGHGHPE